MIEPNTFICADCLDVLKELPDGFADLCLTDPPYGIKRDKGFEGFEGFGGFGKPIARRRFEDNDWDAERPSQQYFVEFIRITKLSIIWGGNFFADLLPRSTHYIFWDKLQTMPTFGDGELAWTNSNRKSIKKVTIEWNGLLGKEQYRYHPTQKPVALFVWCLLNYSKPGDLIIDPFCGSGTTALAAHKTGRQFICIDKEPKYIEIAKKRYADLVAQQDLFLPEPETKIEQERLNI